MRRASRTILWHFLSAFSVTEQVLMMKISGVSVKSTFFISLCLEHPRDSGCLRVVQLAAQRVKSDFFHNLFAKVQFLSVFIPGKIREIEVKTGGRCLPSGKNPVYRGGKPPTAEEVFSSLMVFLKNYPAFIT